MCRIKNIIQGRMLFDIVLKLDTLIRSKQKEAPILKGHLSIRLNCLQRKFMCQGYKDYKRHYLIIPQLNKEVQKSLIWD